MNIRMSLLIIGLFVGNAAYAGPKFDEAMKEKTLESKDHYISRLEMLGLWLIQEIISQQGVYFKKKGQEQRSDLLYLPIVLTRSILAIDEKNLSYIALYEIMDDANRQKTEELKIYVYNWYLQKILEQLSKIGGKAQEKAQEFINYAKAAKF